MRKKSEKSGEQKKEDIKPQAKKQEVKKPVKQEVKKHVKQEVKKPKAILLKLGSRVKSIINGEEGSVELLFSDESGVPFKAQVLFDSGKSEAESASNLELL